MATRFRLSNTAHGTTTPAVQSYTHSATINRRELPTSDASALTNNALAPDAADHIVAGDTLLAQFISEPLGVNTFTIGDAFDMAAQLLESNAGNNLFMQVWMGIVSNDGTTALATLLAKSADATELATTLTSRYHSGVLTGGYTTSGGERLVVEISATGTPVGAGGVQGHNATLRCGGNGAGGDLLENDTQTGTTLNGWLEFANTITFEATGHPASKRMGGVQHAHGAVGAGGRVW